MLSKMQQNTASTAEQDLLVLQQADQLQHVKDLEDFDLFNPAEHPTPVPLRKPRVLEIAAEYMNLKTK